MPPSARCSRSGVSSPSGCAGGRPAARGGRRPPGRGTRCAGPARRGGPAGVDEARTLYRYVLQRWPHHADALRTLRDLAIDDRDWDDAIGLQERLLEIAPPADRASRVLVARGGLLRARAPGAARGARPAAAAGHFKAALRADRDFVPAAVALGDAYEAAGDHREAIRTWERAAETQPALPLLARLERAYRQDARPSRMIALYRNAAARAPDDLALAAALGRVYFELEMLDEATEQFEKLEMRAPDMPVVHAFLGAVFERRGEARAAFDEYRRALRLGHAFDWPASLPRLLGDGADLAGSLSAMPALEHAAPVPGSLSRALHAWAVAALDLVFPALCPALRVDARGAAARSPVRRVLGGDPAPRAARLRSLRSAMRRRSIRRRPDRPSGRAAVRCVPRRSARAGTGRAPAPSTRAWSATRSTRSSSGASGRWPVPLAALIGEQWPPGAA